MLSLVFQIVNLVLLLALVVVGVLILKNLSAYLAAHGPDSDSKRGR